MPPVVGLCVHIAASFLRADVICYFKESFSSGFHCVRVAPEAAQSAQDRLRKLTCGGVLLTKVPAACDDGEATQVQRDKRKDR